MPGTEDCSALKLRLAYRPPYDVEGMLGFLSRRCVPGVESVEGRIVRRTLTLGDHTRRVPGWLAMLFLTQRHEVEVMVSPSFVPLLGRVMETVRAGLDLDAEPALVDSHLHALPGPAGVRVPGGMEGFETAVRVILGQQVTVAAARTLTRRLVERFGQKVDTPFPELNRLFPSPETIAEATPDAIGELGIVRQRVHALRALAREMAEGRLELHRGAPLAQALDALRAMPGVGEWSVQLIALRALAWPDAFPASDMGVLTALGTRSPAEAAARAQSWQPWRAYAVMRLWRSLEPAAMVPAPETIVLETT
jgi:AraC family transcriptional regulator of adaptative response / DNA-3-methyladenine glycosylase II